MKQDSQPSRPYLDITQEFDTKSNKGLIAINKLFFNLKMQNLFF